MKQETVPEFIKRIARKGGKTTLKRHGKNHYREIGKKGLETKRKKKLLDKSV